jgi:hypothetical protein
VIWWTQQMIWNAIPELQWCWGWETHSRIKMPSGSRSLLYNYTLLNFTLAF